ncbi:MAG: hypothetical protein KAS72_11075 [Phycisphaerales bacterium]|nr:hypothetical protein [Phycisphaerales bacterium]
MNGWNVVSYVITGIVGFVTGWLTDYRRMRRKEDAERRQLMREVARLAKDGTSLYREEAVGYLLDAAIQVRQDAGAMRPVISHVSASWVCKARAMIDGVICDLELALPRETAEDGEWAAARREEATKALERVRARCRDYLEPSDAT